MTDAHVADTVNGELLFIRVDDAARMLGISRSLAYELANRWIATDGRHGLPAIRLGRRILVKKAVLERWAYDGS
jgi:excisionase family DNA binding protein